MSFPRFFSAAVFAATLCFHTTQAKAQASPSPAPAPANAPVGYSGVHENPAPSVPPVEAAPVAISTTASPAAAPPSMDAKSAVKAVLAMFNINSAINFEATGKPLPATGAWGAQSQFPAGLPKPCILARLSCMVVIYRVPEINVVCNWTIGLVVVAEPQPDGTVHHATRVVVLDENESAARYTLRTAWPRGEAIPQPTVVQRPAYPKVAQDAHVGGVVAVRLVVGPDGLVKSAVPLAGPVLLQPAVVEAARHWKFDPLTIGQQATSFQIDKQFSFNAGKEDFSAGMDPSGHVVIPQTDPHQEPGFRTDGVSSGQWSSCTTVSCTSAAPDVPK